ncbi:hypothetical protein [Paraburkholderia gardini]|uniref:hypothetical protein n=1 Tax=Paraburkholderia gardini TaxID=2823469 RepID=UPI001D863FDF|nr:hypothetical protein [Paraburkholderia gardini]CAG4924860.1 hypothetical protein R69919_05248 [Paraburkholderia gardini]
MSYDSVFADIGLRQLTAEEERDIRAGKWNKPTPKAGELKMITRADSTGRVIREFRGDKSAWMDQFKSDRWLQIGIPQVPGKRGVTIECSPTTGEPLAPMYRDAWRRS